MQNRSFTTEGTEKTQSAQRNIRRATRGREIPRLRSGRVSVPPPDAESSSVFKERSAPVKRANFQTSNFALPPTVFFRLAQLVTLRSWDNVQ